MGIIKPPIGRTMAAAPRKKSNIVSGSLTVPGMTYSNISTNSRDTQPIPNVVVEEKYMKVVRYNHNIKNLTNNKL